MGWELTLALLIVAGIAMTLGALFASELWLAERVLPGVSVWDVDLGGLTHDQAMERLAAGFYYPTNRRPTLRYGNQEWAIDPEDLGTRLDVAATVDTAMALGHEGDLGARLEEQIEVLRDGRLIMPIFASEPGSGAMFLSQIARQVNLPSHNATLLIEEDLSVEVIPGQTGREVDEATTLQTLAERMEGMEGGDVELVVRVSEPLVTDLSTARDEVQRIISDPIILTAPDYEPWTIEPAALADWLILQPTVDRDGEPNLAVSLDLGPAAQLAEEIAGQVARAPRDAQFRFDVAGNKVVSVIDSVPGQTLDITTTVSLIESAATSERRAVPLPLVWIRPAVATRDAPDVGAFDLIGEGITNFSGSSTARVTNIVVGTAQFDGLLIAPGQTFSFNRNLGEITAEKGYAESIIIWGNTTKTDVGGGLCQVSSTAFRAAFWAGLPITERWPHRFRVSYYEPPKGLDATIYTPRVDLKWVNDTEEFILIRTHVDKAKKTVAFRFYGAAPGRTVKMDGPHESRPMPHGPTVYRDDPSLAKGQKKQIEWAKDGLDVTVYRTVKEDGEEVRRDTFFSRYHPWQAVYLVGTKED